MKYINADHVLPKELIQEIQKYISGGYMYIPTEGQNKKGWGENTGSRVQIKLRNQNIKEKYSNGKGIEQLAEEYYLSIASIRKIVYTKYSA